MVGLSVDVVPTEDVWLPISLGPGFVVTFCVAFGAGDSRQHFMDGDGHATSSRTPWHITVAMACTQTPGQSSDSAVLVIVSNRPKHGESNEAKRDNRRINGTRAIGFSVMYVHGVGNGREYLINADFLTALFSCSINSTRDTA